MKTNHRAILVPLFTIGFSIGCNASNDPELPVALDALSGPAVITPGCQQRLAARAPSDGARTEYAPGS
jgi:hypothetical protein